MKHGIFITVEDLSSKDAMSNGVIKKIFSQIYALNSDEQLSCRPFILPWIKYKHFVLFMACMFFDLYKALVSELSTYDFIYIRRMPAVHYGFIQLLKRIKEKKPNCRILYEIPTYPYDKEHNTFRLKMRLFIDKLFRIKLKEYVDKIITFSEDNVIFGIPTIKIMNGINCADIRIRKPNISCDTINIIAVAQFARWHGYDRLIEGLNKYYEKKETYWKLYIYFVGDGPEVNNLRNLVHHYNLSKYIIFHGALFGEELTDIFNETDIAVSSLGHHRIGIFLGSFLKSREYLARGIPMISSTKIDILPSGFEYCLYVPEDESSIDMQSILDFYQNLTAKYSIPEIIKNTRKFAEDNCDISKTMLPVIEYLK